MVPIDQRVQVVPVRREMLCKIQEEEGVLSFNLP